MQKRSSRAMTPHSNPQWGVMTPTTLSKVGKYVNNRNSKGLLKPNLTFQLQVNICSKDLLSIKSIFRLSSRGW